MIVSEKLAWQDPTHASVFDEVSLYPGWLMRKRFESFNEVRLLRAHAPVLHGSRLCEIGCATGEFYRYATHYLPHLRYCGYDISRPALERAAQKYGPSPFVLLECDIGEFVGRYGPSEVVFCRDVVLHQADPWRFLGELMRMTAEVLVLRLRTRDNGATVLDIEHCCQYHYDRHWVPYVVLNTDEMLSFITADPRVRGVTISRRYEVLGGHNFRFLPKELYYGETRTAETAVLVRLGEGPRNGRVEVSRDDRPDGRPRYSLFDRAVLRIARNLATSRRWGASS